jgi:hypothetical protein
VNTAIQKHWFLSSIHPFSLFLKRLKDGRGGRMKRKGGERNGGRIKEKKVNGKRIKGRKGKRGMMKVGAG